MLVASTLTSIRMEEEERQSGNLEAAPIVRMVQVKRF